MADEFIGSTSFEVVAAAAILYGATHEYAGSGGNPFPGDGGDFMSSFVEYADAHWDDLPRFIDELTEETKAGIERGRAASERLVQPASASLTGISYWDIMAIYRAGLSRYTGPKFATHYPE